MYTDKLVGMFVGLAIGDMLGMPLEFKQRGTFEELTGPQAGGVFNLPLGYWTDDTSMALCLADSLLECRGYDSYDVMHRYAMWRNDGYRSSIGVCFDVGNQTDTAISDFMQRAEVSRDSPRTSAAGNGTIMRLAPIVIASFDTESEIVNIMRLAAVSARETHYSILAETGTAIFSAMLFLAAKKQRKSEIFDFDSSDFVGAGEFMSVLYNAASQSPDTLKPTGYILDTLEVAVWAFMTSGSFMEGALKAVNLGGDADTIGAVYGQLAGAFYGLDGIPEQWIAILHDSNEIQRVAQELTNVTGIKLLRTRFEEDSLEQF